MTIWNSGGIFRSSQMNYLSQCSSIPDDAHNLPKIVSLLRCVYADVQKELEEKGAYHVLKNNYNDQEMVGRQATPLQSEVIESGTGLRTSTVL
jgi:hypothetical protein